METAMKKAKELLMCTLLCMAVFAISFALNANDSRGDLLDPNEFEHGYEGEDGNYYEYRDGAITPDQVEHWDDEKYQDVRDKYYDW
jgi:hypothetical protein